MEATIITLGFANIPTMERTFNLIALLKRTPRWIVLDNHYSRESSAWLQQEAARYGYLYVDAGRNLGLHHGFNRALELVNTPFVIGVDPDSFPASLGFDEELAKHGRDARNVWISAFNTHSFSEMRNPVLEGELLVPSHPVVNSICCWNVAWLRSIGGVQEPTALYGGLECCMWQFLDQRVHRWVFALNCVEAYKTSAVDLQDRVYLLFKWYHAHEGDPRSWEQFRDDYYRDNPDVENISL
jgi:hypothetical protein